MKQQPFAPPEYKEGIEADAVCGQCGSVNPEGTLICKTCGNNLRDQRLLRMQADQMLGGEVEVTEKSPFLFRALTILGLLVLLWFGLNAGRIASLLTTAENESYSGAAALSPSLFWTGPQKDRYEGMLRELTHNFPDRAEADTAKLDSRATGANEGRYAVYEQIGTEVRFVGGAIIKIEDNIWYFAAIINDSIEIRGQALMANEMLWTKWDESGALYNNAYYALEGMAVLQADGGILVSGQSEHTVTRHQALLYRLL